MGEGKETTSKELSEPAVTDRRNEQVRTVSMGGDGQEGQENLNTERSMDLKS